MPEALAAWKRFNANRKGVASFEYVLLAALMVAATAAAYNSAVGESIRTALTAGMEFIATSVGGG